MKHDSKLVHLVLSQDCSYWQGDTIAGSQYTAMDLLFIILSKIDKAFKEAVSQIFTILLIFYFT